MVFQSVTGVVTHFLPERFHMLRRSLVARAIATLVILFAGVAFGGVAASDPAQAAITSPFVKVFSTNKNGDIVIAANTLMTCAASTACTTVQNSTTSINSPVGADQNNNQTATFVNAYPGTGIFNSSGAELDVPIDGSVLYAALVWGGRTPATGGTGNAQAALRGNVKFTTPDGVTRDLVGEVDANPGSGTDSVGYQGFIDVTDIVSETGSGEYVVSNVQSISGASDNYAGWALVVAVADPNAPMRNLTVFQGFGVIQNNSADRSATFTIDGFLTPPTGPVKTTVGAVVYEGDRGLTGDSLSVGSVALTDTLNPSTDVFNSTISNRGAMSTGRTPSYNNQLGFDADLIQAPDNTVPNGATSANITVTTASETYYPGIITFATDLYDPKLTGAKTATQVTDVGGDGNLSIGDTLRFAVEVKNEGLDTATQSTFFDAIPTGTDYVPGSITVNGAPLTDAAGDDTATYSVGPNGGSIAVNLGTGATASSGGDIPLYDMDVPTANVATVTFDVVVNSTAVPYQEIVNAASLRYRGKTTQAASASVSNMTADVIPGSQTGLSPEAPSRVVAMTPSDAEPSITVDLLATASDPDSEPMSIVDITDPAGGTAVLNSDGTVTYTPEGDFAGRDVISYTVEDSSGNRTSNLLRFDVNNLPPVAAADAQDVSHSAISTVTLLSNDTDENDDDLHVRSITASGVTVTDSGSVTTARGGTATLAGGTVTYTPPSGGLTLGATDTFTYVAQDTRGGVSNSATATLTSVNAAPVASADTHPVVAATPTVMDPRDNDSDADGDPLTISAFTQPANGVVTQLGDGTLRYTPNDEFVGTDTYNYTVSDGITTHQSTVTLEVAKIGTSVGITVDPASTEYGTPATLTASGIPTGAGGTIEFRDADGAVLCTATPSAPACDTSGTLAVGSYNITAVYSGDASHDSSTSPSETLSVTKQITTVTTSVSDAGSVPFGAPATLTASGLPTTATGTVEFRDQDGALLCATTLPALSCQTSATLPAGDYEIVGTYSGDDNHEGSSSAAADLTVTPAVGTMSVTTGGSSVYGSPASLTVHGLPSTATGDVEFRSADGTVLCTTTLPSVSCMASAWLAAGDYEITAVYEGDANHAAVSSIAAPLTVVPQPTGVIATAPDGTTGTYGTSIRLAPTGLPAGATGTVEFRLSDGTVLCTVTLPGEDCALPTDLPVGTSSIVAVYSGDSNYQSSTSAPMTVEVAARPVTVVAQKPVKATAGKVITLTATGIPSGATGTIAFVTESGTVLCTAVLPSLSCDVEALAAGNYVITPRYSGDANNLASEGDPIELVVSAPNSGLPFMGTEAAGAAALAVLLLGIGSALLVVRRRRLS
ncbi:Ig-like domain repeat protein [Salinibacterium sp. SYSU T00001]|uniref:Ig-like domain repeat protein n=1 Tax=Homoserinimonas sedimenticola TaxID=2986805 RepID=UPI002235C700|nr:Ig-like domain repeat protein [Salinibacterium sedimenticola]MCW4385544.1 Ig-like domain repeat protein [Salinibacterium sedimenticola]